MSNVKSYTLQEIYDSHVWKIDEGNNVHYLLSLVQVNTYVNLNNQDRVKVKYHGYHCGSLYIQSVWLDDNPLMVIGSSDDDEKIYISDIHAYIDLRTYLMSFVNIRYKVVQANEPVLGIIGDYYVQEILQ